MNDFIAARSQMAVSLGFHIIFVCISMVMPFFMAIAHFKYLKTGNELYKGLTKAWSMGVAILFATGAVSGTLLSFELGLLFPKFMQHAGPIFGMPFSLEGTAFFVEAIAIGFFMYGWNRFNKWFHWFTGLLIGVTGITSGILVMSANAWMNSPAGFDFENGQYLNIDPVKAMFNNAWFTETVHMIIAAFVCTGFSVAGVHALMILKKKNLLFHRTAFKIAATTAVVAALLQPLSGDMSAKDITKRQPEKLAAAEALFHTEAPASLLIGGVVDEKDETVKYAIRIPRLLSFLAHGDFTSPVTGLSAFPQDDRPPVAIVHYSFQLMVFIGMLLVILAVIYIIASWKKKNWFTKRWFWKSFVFATPLGFIALESGWIVTEVGRQPWVIYKIMRTIDGVTPMHGIQYTFYLLTFVFIVLALVVFFLMKRQLKMVPYLYDPTDEHYKSNK